MMKGYVARLCAASGFAFLALVAIAYAQRAARPIPLAPEGQPDQTELPADEQQQPAPNKRAARPPRKSNRSGSAMPREDADPFSRRGGERKKASARQRGAEASEASEAPQLLPAAARRGSRIPLATADDDSEAPVRLLGGQSDAEEDVASNPSPSEESLSSAAEAPASDGGNFQPEDAADDEPLADVEPPTAGPRSIGRSRSAIQRGASSHADADGTGRPGDASLEGLQSPALAIEKRAPAEVQVGRAAVIAVYVRNVGNVPAHGITVRDEVPRGSRLISTTPQASLAADGALLWELGTLPPGGEANVQMEILPLTEGELGSVAVVGMQAQASARSVCTRPQLAMEVEAVPTVLIGEQVVLSIHVSNPGTGAATGVVLTEYVPEGLSHPGGSELEYEIGELAPGETREIELTMTAAQAGKLRNLLVARAEGGLEVQKETPIEVTAPALRLEVHGPRKRYLERQARYTLTIANPGTAPAHNISLVAYVPTGMEFVDANNAGQFDPATGTVHWQLDELPVQAEGSVTLTVLPTQTGEFPLRAEAAAALGLSAEAETSISVEGVAAILLEVADISDPVEVGGETTYEIHVVNQGSKAAENVQVMAILPTQMKPLSAEGPTRHLFDGPQVRFAPLARLAPKADTMYRLRVQCQEAGDLRVRVQLLTDDIQEPVREEESTRVYDDG
ncbi:MAG: DUF11 domain-containing protein [Pirellulales bacterium]|nr:DUF11 domain-containing protein [Pirellulales bacterium]